MLRCELLVREQIAFLALAAGIADHAGRAADDGDRRVAGLLEAPQHQQRQQMADVQAVGRGIEAGVDACAAFRSSHAERPASSVV